MGKELKGIITKFNVENENLLLIIGDSLMDNVGNQTSIRTVAITAFIGISR